MKTSKPIGDRAFAQLAIHARVGLSTVRRVLNGGRASANTAERVVAACRALGIEPTTEALERAGPSARSTETAANSAPREPSDGEREAR